MQYQPSAPVLPGCFAFKAVIGDDRFIRHCIQPATALHRIIVVLRNVGLMSSRGVPSRMSTSARRRMQPSMFNNRTHEIPSAFGRAGARVANRRVPPCRGKAPRSSWQPPPGETNKSTKCGRSRQVFQSSDKFRKQGDISGRITGPTRLDRCAGRLLERRVNDSDWDQVHGWRRVKCFNIILFPIIFAFIRRIGRTRLAANPGVSQARGLNRRQPSATVLHAYIQCQQAARQTQANRYNSRSCSRISEAHRNSRSRA